jgi:hypothetical protein
MGREAFREIEDSNNAMKLVADWGVSATSIILAYIGSAWFVNPTATIQIQSNHYIPKAY